MSGKRLCQILCPSSCWDPSSGLCWRRVEWGEWADSSPSTSAGGRRRKAVVGPVQGRREAVGPQGDRFPDSDVQQPSPLMPRPPPWWQHALPSDPGHGTLATLLFWSFTVGAGLSALSSSSSSHLCRPQSSSHHDSPWSIPEIRKINKNKGLSAHGNLFY